MNNGHRITPTAHQRRILTHGTNTTNNVANTVANGLFLLSQAHQELTKHEEAQRANRSDGDDDAPPSNATIKRGAKCKSHDVSASPPPHLPKPAPLKRARATQRQAKAWRLDLS